MYVRCKAYFVRELAIHSVTSAIVVAGPSQVLKMVNSSRRQNGREGEDGPDADEYCTFNCRR